MSASPRSSASRSWCCCSSPRRVRPPTLRRRADEAEEQLHALHTVRRSALPDPGARPRSGVATAWLRWRSPRRRPASPRGRWPPRPSQTVASSTVPPQPVDSEPVPVGAVATIPAAPAGVGAPALSAATRLIPLGDAGPDLDPGAEAAPPTAEPTRAEPARRRARSAGYRFRWDPRPGDAATESAALHRGRRRQRRRRDRAAALAGGTAGQRRGGTASARLALRPQALRRLRRLRLCVAPAAADCRSPPARAAVA